jgi:hypothetical protein
MGVSNYNDLAEHKGHKFECISYGDDDPKYFRNIALQCITCQEVIIDFEEEEE